MRLHQHTHTHIHIIFIICWISSTIYQSVILYALKWKFHNVYMNWLKRRKKSNIQYTFYTEHELHDIEKQKQQK